MSSYIPPALALEQRASLRSAFASTRNIDFDGTVTRALLDLNAWVLEDAEAAPSTRYDVSADTQIVVPDSAERRRVCGRSSV